MVGELDNGTVYVFELRAVNAGGQAGQVSEAVEVVMLLDPGLVVELPGRRISQGSEADVWRRFSRAAVWRIPRSV